MPCLYLHIRVRACDLPLQPLSTIHRHPIPMLTGCVRVCIGACVSLSSRFRKGLLEHGSVGFVIGPGKLDANRKFAKLRCWFDRCRSTVLLVPSSLNYPKHEHNIQRLIDNVEEIYVRVCFSI